MHKRSMQRASCRLVLVLGALLAPLPASAQNRQNIEMDPARARHLYVSDRPEDHPIADYQTAIRRKAAIDSIYRAASRGVLDFQKVTYRSRVGDLDIPAYVFQPLQKRGPRGHAALIWVHGGVHGNWDSYFFPFVKEAIERGYVVIAPEYRGSTGYGKDFHNAIDYGGHEIDDVLTAYDYLLKNLPHVDPDRVGIMGWSHGGFITLHAVLREDHPFKVAAAIVPVTNLVFRLGYKGPNYARSFSTQQRIQGMPHEKRDTYIERSPLYKVDRLNVPLLVHVATNDDDVDFVEAEQLINALRAKKPHLAETKVYVDPPGGHAFSRRVDPASLQRLDTPEQIDSWNRTWVFLEWSLRPYLDGSRNTRANP